MQEDLAQVTDVAAGDLGMHVVGRPGVAAQIAAEKSQTAVVLPRSESQRVSEKEIPALQPITIMFWRLEYSANFCRQFRCDTLIGIENEHPFVLRLRNRPIAEVTAGHVFSLDQPAAEL